MRLNSLITPAFAVALTFNVTLAPALLAADDEQNKTKRGVVAANDDRYDRQSARRLIGQDAKTVSGEGLGQVKDLVVDSRAGSIVYALIGSGGLLGVGEKLRAVPFAAFKDTYTANGDLVLDIDRRNWDSIPVVRENEIDTLAVENRGRPLFERFDLDWKDEMKAAQASSDKAPARLMRATKITGKNVVNAGQEVGTVEDVLINFEARRASVLIDPDDDYTGTNQKFIISFDQLSQSLDDREKLTTPLTRAEFSRATPAQENWWMTTGGYPYVWTGYGTVAGPGYTATSAGAAGVARNEAERSVADAEAATRPSAVMVRGALRMDDDLKDVTNYVSIDERGNRLVLSGTVPSEDVKEKVEEKVTEVAKGGWMIDNQLTVRTTAE